MGEGAAVEVPTAREIVPNVDRISAALREAGGTNVFLRYTCDPAEKQPWTTRYAEYLSAERSALHSAAFTRGAGPWQLWPLLRLRPNDPVVAKNRVSGFCAGPC